MNNIEIYPWQLESWQRILGMRERMPHALLLHGRQGIGKLAFANALAHALLCESPDNGFACGSCLSCGWMAQGNHPDFRLIEPEDRAEGEADGGGAEGDTVASRSRRKSRFIVVDQIRALNELTALSTHRNGLRIMVLHPAEALNANAANALLKMLEEPPPATLFLLITHQAQRLLPTIRSRCHKIAMPVPSRSASEAWLSAQGVVSSVFCLAQAGGAPLAAMEADSAAVREEVEAFASQLSLGGRIDPFSAATAWAKNDFGAAIAALQKWCYDLMSVRLADQVRYFPHQLSSLQAMGKSVDLWLLLEFQRILIEARAQVSHSLNTELQLEALLVRYAQLFPGSTKT